MDALDPVALIEWIYDPLEDRYGRAVAWIVTFGVALGLVGAFVGILIYVA